MCVEIFDRRQAGQLQKCLHNCDCIRFSDGFWYKFTKKGITKEQAVATICQACAITPQEIMAFGDDYVDLVMLQACGLGIAMGNVVEEAKEKAGLVISTNDEDGIAEYLESYF